MKPKENLPLEFLERAVRQSLEEGYYKFGAQGPYADQRIPISSMFSFNRGWAELLLDKVFEEPSRGLIGYYHEEAKVDIDWYDPIHQALQRRGAEFPLTTVSEYSYRIHKGVPLTDYPQGSILTGFCEVATLGKEFRQLQGVAEHFGLSIGRFVALIDRNPEPITEIDGVPFASVLHLPLPLYQTISEVPIPAEHAWLSPYRYQHYFASKAWHLRA